MCICQEKGAERGKAKPIKLIPTKSWYALYKDIDVLASMKCMFKLSWAAEPATKWMNNDNHSHYYNDMLFGTWLWNDDEGDVTGKLVECEWISFAFLSLSPQRT